MLVTALARFLPRRVSRAARAASPIALAAFALAVFAPAALASGAPDTAFGSGGLAQGSAGAQLFGVASGSDGSVVAAGTSGGKVFVERLSATGAVTGSYTGPAGVARAVAITSSGSVVIAGSSGGAMLVERLTPQLTADGSFGSGGIATAFGGQSAVANAVGLESDGSVVAGGTVGSGSTEAAAMRVSSTGAVLWANPFNFGPASGINGLAVQPADGKIVVVGSQRPLQVVNGVVARLTSGGALDSSFAGGQGAFTYSYPGSGSTVLQAVTLQSDGKIVAAGNAASGPTTVVLRTTATGSLDPSFGSGGVATAASGQNVSLQSYSIGAYGVAVAANGDVVAAGSYENTGVAIYGGLWAFTSAGAPDTSFGAGGTQKFPTSNQEACALSIDPSGRLVTVGDTVAQLPDDSPCTVRTGSQGYAARFTAIAVPTITPPPPPPVVIPPFKASVSGLASSYKKKDAHKSGITVGVNCNQACSFTATVGASATIARELKIGQRVRRCRKVHGKKRCTTVVIYKPITIQVVRGRLTKLGTAKFTLKSGRFKDAVDASKNKVTLSFTVVATATATKKKITIKKTLTFR